MLRLLELESCCHMNSFYAGMRDAELRTLPSVPSNSASYVPKMLKTNM